VVQDQRPGQPGRRQRVVLGSLVWPEKPMVSPTVQVRGGVGVSMTAAGGELPAVIVTEAGSLASPRLSVTLSLAV